MKGRTHEVQRTARLENTYTRNCCMPVSCLDVRLAFAPTFYACLLSKIMHNTQKHFSHSLQAKVIVNTSHHIVSRHLLEQ